MTEESVGEILSVLDEESVGRPELEAFDLGMINYAKYLIRKGWVQPPYYFNLILGNIACAITGDTWCRDINIAIPCLCQTDIGAQVVDCITRMAGLTAGFR